MSSLAAPLAFPLGADNLLTNGFGVDHVAAAIGRLRSQFAKDPAVVALVTIFAERYQTLEVAFWALLTLRGIYNSKGAQLDAIGKIVGRARAGLDDDTYRRYLLAEIVAHKSDGVREDLIAIARLVVNDPTATVTVIDEGTATVRVIIGAAAITAIVGTVLEELEQLAASAGVRIRVTYSLSPPGSTFKFDSGPGYDIGHLAS